MSDPFLEPRHAALGERVRDFAATHLTASEDERDPVARTLELVRAMGQDRLLAAAIPPPAGEMDLRSLCLVREALAWHSSLADTAFAMQGLGTLPISLAGDAEQRERWLPAVLAGGTLAAFALTEPDAGSDLERLATRAERQGAEWSLSGTKTLISNGGIAGVYTVLARSGGPGSRGLSMFVVEGGAPGLGATPLEPMAPHPLAELRFDGTPARLLGEEGGGLRLALSTLDRFRPSVGAAACGLAARALAEALAHVRSRELFGGPLAEQQGVQLALAEMEVELRAARLLVKQAAWKHDSGAERITREGAAAKLFATEMAQRVVDRALQLHGGKGVLKGAPVERLYREVRSLRIYEGASEIQKLILARALLSDDSGR